jgi:ribosome recycling factor
MAYNFAQFKQQLQGVEEWLKKEYSSISTGRANPALLDSVNVEAYGTFQPIRNLATISVEDARTLRIVPWDKGQIKDIEKAIQSSGLPISVSSDAAGLRASIPQLTTENKAQITKLAKAKLEESRVSVRMERQKVDKDIDENEKVEDDKFRAKEELQKIVDATNKKLEELCDAKCNDLMTV